MHVLGTGRCDRLGNIAVGVINVSEEASVCAAHLHASGLLAHLLQMVAKRALLDHLGLRIEAACTIGARGHTHLATDALFLVNQNLTVFLALIGGPRRAHLHTGSLTAVLANGR